MVPKTAIRLIITNTKLEKSSSWTIFMDMV